MKRNLIPLIIGLILLIISTGAEAQQVYQFSHYMQNLYILNTASAGMHDYTEVNMSFRKQWVGINNSPTTYYVSGSAPLGKRLDVKPKKSSVRIGNVSSYSELQRKSFHAVGGYVAKDEYGPYGLTMLGVSYAFSLATSRRTYLEFLAECRLQLRIL